MLRTCPIDAPVQAAGDPELPPLRTRLRLFDDGLVFAYTEDEGGGIYKERCVGRLSRDLLAELPREHHRQVLDWIEEEEDAIRYGHDCRIEALRRY